MRFNDAHMDLMRWCLRGSASHFVLCSSVHFDIFLPKTIFITHLPSKISSLNQIFHFSKLNWMYINNKNELCKYLDCIYFGGMIFLNERKLIEIILR